MKIQNGKIKFSKLEKIIYFSTFDLSTSATDVLGIIISST
jgi:hypothetical protein